MSSTIEQLFTLSAFSPGTEKKVAFKESMEWRNIFDKAMLNVFDQEGNVDSNKSNNLRQQTPVEKFDQNSSKQMDLSIQDKNTVVTEKNFNSAPVSTKNPGVFSKIFSEHNANQNLIINGTISVDKDLGQLKTSVYSTQSSKNVNRFSFAEFNQTFGRVHLTKSEAGIKVFVRNYNSEPTSVLKMIKDIVEQIKYRDIAIHEIKLNGKLVKL